MDKNKVINIENTEGQDQIILRNVMRMVPNKDRNDLSLKRLLAFRLRIDGEGATRSYLMRQIRNMSQCSYTGRLYDFIKDDEQLKTCPPMAGLSEPPDSA